MSAFMLRIWRLSLFLGLTLPLMAVQWALLALGSRAARALPRFYHRLCRSILGFRVVVLGQPSDRPGTLFVVNHASYFDIILLGGLIEGSFVAKSEVATWPLFGWLAKLQRTVFVDRQIRTTAVQRNAIVERLAQGENLILFPEGTSNDGNRLLPFKSALFSAAAAEDMLIPVQPVSIAYVALDGMPMGRLFRPLVAWYGDMELTPHLWEFMGLGLVKAVIEFHPIVTLPEMGSRKALSEHCRNVIAEGLSLALSGRLPLPEIEEPPPERRKKRRRKKKATARMPAKALPLDGGESLIALPLDGGGKGGGDAAASVLVETSPERSGAGGSEERAHDNAPEIAEPSPPPKPSPIEGEGLQDASQKRTPVAETPPEQTPPQNTVQS